MGSAGPGEESPQQTGTKGPAEKLAGEARLRGRGGRHGSGGGGAKAGPQPAVPPPPWLPPTAVSRAPFAPCLPSPAAALAALPGGRGSVRSRVAPAAGPVAPPSLFIKLPRAAGRGGGTTGASKQSNRCGTREVRGPVTAQFGQPLAHPATHPLWPGGGAGGPGRGDVAADPPGRRCSASNFTVSASLATPGRPAAVAWALRPSNFGAVRWRTMPSDAAAAAAPQV